MNITDEQRGRLDQQKLAVAGIATIGYDAEAGDLLVHRLGGRRQFFVYLSVTPRDFDDLTLAPDLRKAIGDVSRTHPTTHFQDAMPVDFKPTKAMDFVGVPVEAAAGAAPDVDQTAKLTDKTAEG